MTPKTTASPSQGAREIAEKVTSIAREGMVDYYSKEMRFENDANDVAALIDAELAEVLPHLGHTANCRYGKEDFRAYPRRELYGCTCGLAALLERFTPGK